MVRQTHVFIWLLQFPRYLQFQSALLLFTLFVQSLLVSFLLPQAFALLKSPTFKGALGKPGMRGNFVCYNYFKLLNMARIPV